MVSSQYFVRKSSARRHNNYSFFLTPPIWSCLFWLIALFFPHSELFIPDVCFEMSRDDAGCFLAEKSIWIFVSYVSYVQIKCAFSFLCYCVEYMHTDSLDNIGSIKGVLQKLFLQAELCLQDSFLSQHWRMCIMCCFCWSKLTLQSYNVARHCHWMWTTTTGLF